MHALVAAFTNCAPGACVQRCASSPGTHGMNFSGAQPAEGLAHEPSIHRPLASLSCPVCASNVIIWATSPLSQGLTSVLLLARQKVLGFSQLWTMRTVCSPAEEKGLGRGMIRGAGRRMSSAATGNFTKYECVNVRKCVIRRAQVFGDTVSTPHANGNARNSVPVTLGLGKRLCIPHTLGPREGLVGGAVGDAQKPEAPVPPHGGLGEAGEVEAAERAAHVRPASKRRLAVVCEPGMADDGGEEDSDRRLAARVALGRSPCGADSTVMTEICCVLWRRLEYSLWHVDRRHLVS